MSVKSKDKTYFFTVFSVVEFYSILDGPMTD